MTKSKLLWWSGVVLLALSVHTNWASPLAAWLFAVPLLLFTAPRGLPKVLGALAIGTTVWLAATSLLFVPAALLAFGALTVLQWLAFVAHKLLSPRLPGFLGTLVFPATLAGAEYLFALVIRFGDYGALGSTQHANLPLLQLASVTGVYGITFLMGWFASTAVWAWETRNARRFVVYGLVLAAVFAAGAARLTFFAPTEKSVRVAAVSPSHTADERSGDALSTMDIEYWRAAEVATAEPGAIRAAFAPVTDDLLEQTRTQARAGAKIVLWPETHARVLERDHRELLDSAAVIARETGAYVNLAYAMYTGEAPNIRNLSTMITPAGEIAWTYDKSRPTPMEPMTPGPGEVPTVDTPYGRIAGVICYDADFPHLMRQAADKGADLLLVPANDWAGFSELHAEKAVFRDIEYGYSMLRNSSHGLSTATDAQGRVLASTDWFRTDQQTLVANLPLQPRTSTVYSTVGDVFAWLCLAGAAALALTALRRSPATEAAHATR
ncbi:nitrilase-related carbon-nitrogen hydrolase [Amycolatopsis sp. 195334CR]|uniref:apolipoprotein N-acyltransferase n=1 Tax=Amycolatopsis sp. 195334CR TaxID=2814588 RepID=UPI001A8DB9C5|nr:nitrilase-related carbon-nitrogen hydrolase [Amycolatopsis sp. 195334CR]MBN6034416.1 apolipoprotein acyltransferase [Amycolatopsis sp. 195334CR]